MNLDAVDDDIIDDSVSETGTLSDDGSINFDDDFAVEKNSPSWGSLNLPSTDSAGDFSEYTSDLDNFHGYFVSLKFPHFVAAKLAQLMNTPMKSA